ncbi:MAG: OmpA family protein [Bacteroidetes bacterium]|nr:OmpA family protein [Bacteroidota bacterium]
MKKIIATCVLLVAATHLFCQKTPSKSSITVKPKFILNGRTDPASTIIRVKSRIVRIEKGIIKSDKWAYTQQIASSSDGEFILVLSANTDKQYNVINYSVEFYKKGYATKKMLLNTYVPKDEYDRHPWPKYDYDLDVSLVSLTKSSDSTYAGRISWNSDKQEFVQTQYLEAAAIKQSAIAADTGSITLADSIADQKDELPSVKRFSISGIFYTNEENTPLSNSKVSLADTKGEVIQSTNTDFFGSYTFLHLTEGKNYTISIDSFPPSFTVKKVIMTTRDGKQITESESSTTFKYELIANDSNTISHLTVDEGNLLTDINGRIFSDKKKRTPLAYSKLILTSGENKMRKSIVTDMNGNFHFKNLPVNQNYTLMLDEKDPSVFSKEVFLSDMNGNVLKRLKSHDNQYFHFYFLPPDQNGLSSVYYNDPWLKASSLQGKKKLDSLIIIEKIYYDFGKWEISSEAMLTLNKPIEIMKKNPNISIEIISHTDSRGDKEFNKKLSAKRASAAVEYIISKGIDKNRIHGNGMGEQQLVNRCKEGVECTEEEHSQNRRTEFRVRYLSK